ncbi:TPA: DUF4406 domain-containing protein [Pseudomonas aeruginosa]|uniref:DUF4406 domain-containing protein n=1 Tax=Pseudomonas aeruginosa TaxID=287 RepID=UPI0014955415|nr:DUF4406 domain-containing protein [Pseudomonas aeruginosa]MCT5494910.1 DUF4406 domain-containing protein [Pseudomonas aeruginosa]MCT5537268.1 DUF4406 domain-containing protein [Pseudomonas aeruginosa]MDP5656765.1 DUF4406 domain-containing protein [Pseudomonas aeruginosa]NPS61864.1 DUF4406 domain-containing protein [Pseudomonas aeruginosa]UIN43623.1 DUF4406 domain-containing protein [Pseudomonas aeruginosa]
MERIYLAGPMTGLPEFNYPAFHAEAARLRQLGYHVENPAEINPDGGSWSDCMRRDIPRLLTCDAFALLPGWLSSRGANVEHGLAVQLGMTITMAADVTEPARSAA